MDALEKGDTVWVRPDDMIPADGVIIEGESSVNQAGLTGESVPVDKAPGDTVWAGTWNRSGALTVKVSRRNADNALSRLIRLVREAEAKKAPIQHVADRWASRIVPAAILCSFLVAGFAYFILDTSFLSALIRGVTVLVVFCPCAFALATPTAIAAGIGNAARRGILIKSGEALENLAGTDTVVFDKTGTLTRAELRIEAHYSAGRLSEREMLAWCAAAESRSQHPIAQAIVEAAKEISLPRARNISAKNGIGITCDIDGEEILVCSVAALEKERIPVPAPARAFIDTRNALGETLVCLAADGSLEGIFFSLGHATGTRRRNRLRTQRRRLCHAHADGRQRRRRSKNGEAHRRRKLFFRITSGAQIRKNKRTARERETRPHGRRRRKRRARARLGKLLRRHGRARLRNCSRHGGYYDFERSSRFRSRAFKVFPHCFENDSHQLRDFLSD